MTRMESSVLALISDAHEKRGALKARQRYQLRGLPLAMRNKVHHALFASWRD